MRAARFSQGFELPCRAGFRFQALLAAVGRCRRSVSRVLRSLVSCCLSLGCLALVARPSNAKHCCTARAEPPIFCNPLPHNALPFWHSPLCGHFRSHLDKICRQFLSPVALSDPPRLARTVPAPTGSSRVVPVRPGSSRSDSARSGLVWLGSARSGLVWFGPTRSCPCLVHRR